MLAAIVLAIANAVIGTREDPASLCGECLFD